MPHRLQGGFLGCAFALLLKKDSPTISFMVTVGAAFVLFSLAAGFYEGIRSFISLLSESAGISSSAVSTVFKTCGIAIMTKLMSDVCKDASQNAAGTAVELVGTGAAFAVSMPFMKTVLGMITELMK